MFKRCLLFILLGIQLVSLAGCWDYRDINRTDFPRAGSYDLHEVGLSAMREEGDQEQLIDLAVILPNLAQDAPSKFRIEKTTGLNVGNARGQKPYTSAGTYSPGVTGIIVVGEDLAGIGLNNIFQALFRGALTPNTQSFAIAEGRADSILETPVEDFANMGDYLKGILQKSERRGFIPATTLHHFEVWQAPGKNPIMPLLKLKNNKAEVIGTAIFKKDRMIGKANLTETRSLMMLRGIKATGNVAFTVKRNGVIFDRGSVDVSNKRKVKVERNGDDINFLITVMLEGNLVEHQFGKLFTKDENLRRIIEAQIASNIEAECNRFINKMQENYKVDCIDISKYAVAKWGKEVENQVDQGFIENVNIKVKVKMKLKNTGELT
ncbi:MAG: Ger(x)C family spore germination protein [Syntrophomonas sp.]